MSAVNILKHSEKTLACREIIINYNINCAKECNMMFTFFVLCSLFSLQAVRKMSMEDFISKGPYFLQLLPPNFAETSKALV